MPTNFIKKLKRPVRLKPEETCCWERHLEWGYAARSLWRQLNRLDSVKESGLCFAKDVKAIQKGSRKFRGGKQVGAFSYDTLQNLLLDFERAGLISCRFEDDEGDYAGLSVFMVHGQHMHDALCERSGNFCRYIGWNNPVLKEKGTQPGTQAGTEILKKGTQPGTQGNTQGFEKRYPSGDPAKTPQSPQNEMVIPPPEKSDLRNSAPNHVISQSLEAIIQSGDSAVSHSHVLLSESQNLKADLGLSVSMTDQNQPQTLSPAPRRMLETIRQHFGYTVTLEKISEEEIEQKKIDRYGLRVDWEGLRECCQAEVEEKAKLPYLGRKTNGDIMAGAMVRWTDKHRGEKVDKFWYRVAKTLREGGPSKYQPDLEVKGTSSVFIRAAEETGVDITQFNLAWNDVESYRDGWQRLSQLKPEYLSEPGLIKIRDWLWENDAMSDKPATPPWKTP